MQSGLVKFELFRLREAGPEACTLCSVASTHALHKPVLLFITFFKRSKQKTSVGHPPYWSCMSSMFRVAERVVSILTFVLSIGEPFPSRATSYPTQVGFSQRPLSLAEISPRTTTCLHSKLREQKQSKPL